MSVQAPETPDILALRTQVLEALTAAGATPLTLQQIRDTENLPSYYTEVIVTLRYRGEPRMSGHHCTTFYRISTRPVADIEDTAYDELKAVDAGLRGARLVVDEEPTTPVQFETADDITADDGKWSGLTTWTTTRKNRRAS